MGRSWTYGKVLTLALLLCSGEVGGTPSRVGLSSRTKGHEARQVFVERGRPSALSSLNHVSKRGYGSGSSGEAGFYGFLGCNFNPSICGRDEQCVDDNLFGSCQKNHQPTDLFQYHLTPSQSHDLEQALVTLIQDGYAWGDLYTQCVIGNVLLAVELGQTVDPMFCDDGSIPRRAESRSYVERIQTRSSWLPAGNEQGVALISDDDGDGEFVNVHKYEKERKRLASNHQFLELPDIAIPPDSANGFDFRMKEKKSEAERADELTLYLAGLDPEELDMLEDVILKGDSSAQKFKDYLPDRIVNSNEADLEPDDNTEFLNFRDSSAVNQPTNDESSPLDLQPINDKLSRADVENDVVPDKRLESVRAHSVRMQSDLEAAPSSTFPPGAEVIDTSYAYVIVQPEIHDRNTAQSTLYHLAKMLNLSPRVFSDISLAGKGSINFRVNQKMANMSAATLARSAMDLSDALHNVTGLRIIEAGIGRVAESSVTVEEVFISRSRYFSLLLILCLVVTSIVFAAILIYFLNHYIKSRQKLSQLNDPRLGRAGTLDETKEYQDLCRQHMLSKMCDKPEPIHFLGRIGSVAAVDGAGTRSPSSRSSTSSWSEEPVAASMDILTGHIVLSYMEDHLNNKDRLDKEWDSLKAYEPELITTDVALLLDNKSKNRYIDILPYDHSRVVLHTATNQNGCDYINASSLTDHDPRSPAYIVTQGPLPHTVADFWQAVWEQGCVVIVCLTKMSEKGTPMCSTYWPAEGSVLHHIYEVHLVSEHIWCEDYLIRSFYLKNLQTNETRTVTQFHFMTWPDLGVPASSKSLLDFRRKVNKSFRGRSCPILVHCSDGAGRSGTYCLIDMVLNKISKGAKEIDIAATLEHIRDQRMEMVKTKEQFQFVLATVAEEVHAVLKALPQS